MVVALSWRAEAPRALGARADKVKMRASILFYLKRAQKARHAGHGGVMPGRAMAFHDMRCDLMVMMECKVMRRPNRIAVSC